VWGHLPVPFFHKVRRLAPHHMDHFQPEELQQLYQMELILRLEAPDLGLDTSHEQHYEALLQGVLAGCIDCGKVAGWLVCL